MRLPARLNNERLLESTHLLANDNPDFARIVKKHGPPPLWDRQPGFATLLRIVLEQQVSLKSAAAMYGRIESRLSRLTPGTLLAAGEQGLRDLGVTRQKAFYLVNIARAIADGELELSGLDERDDEAVTGALTSIRGVGPWTANIYLLMALCRPDAWPPGDIALATAYRRLKGLPLRPISRDMDRIALAWRPHRATAARLLWHYYLEEKRNGKNTA